MAVAACAALTLTAAPAYAAGGGFIRDSAICPSGKVTIGGGAQVVNSGSGDFSTSIQESAPGALGGTSLWLTALKNNGTVSRTIGLFTACATASPSGYQVVRRDVTISALGFLRDVVSCPSGKVALAGGAQVVGSGSADFKTSMQESSPGTLGGSSVWLVAMRNNDLVSHTVGMFAVCAYAPSGYQVVHTDYPLAAGGFLRNISSCPSGKVVFGGGAQVVGAGSADFKTSIQETAPGGANGLSIWLMAMKNKSTSAYTVGVSAVCGYAPAGYEVIRRDVTVA